ncbi:MAG: ATP/GTP-binding protein, partial [Chloroflexota bacterium]|nr:ATP/GTP-binding protein [Chloroflexota bacterium]
MGKTKIVITGPFNAGKTEFIRTVSDIPIVSTERSISDHLKSVKSETTVAMDYGHVKVNSDVFHLYGTPGQPRFDFMWDILSQEMQAFILMVDSCDRGTFPQARRLIRIFRRKARVPYMVVANKQDGRKALSVQKVGGALKLDSGIPVLPCIATDEESACKVLEGLKPL